MINNISLVKPEQCCGCLVCADCCPAGCIHAEENPDGFIHPIPDDERCLNCGACLKVCPALEYGQGQVADKVIAAHCLDTEGRLKGSSGGVFGVLAKQVIEKGGKVWGAAFDGKLQLKHVRVSSLEELEKLYKSKYLQSDTCGVWKAIKEDLDNSVYTLFSGTPCQCRALRNFLKKEYANLVIVDIICHGVPNQKLFNNYLKDYEAENGGHVVDFTFRYKAADFQYDRGFCMRTEKNGKSKEVKGLYYRSPFYYGFYQEGLLYRSSCLCCNWADIKRVGDITLGDFWGIEKYMEIKDSGCSAVLLNTPQGKELFNYVKEKLHWRVLPLETVIENNECLQRSPKRNKKRESFFEDYRTHGFGYVKKKYMQPTRKYRFIKGIYFSLPQGIRKGLRKWLAK